MTNIENMVLTYSRNKITPWVNDNNTVPLKVFRSKVPADQRP